MDANSDPLKNHTKAKQASRMIFKEECASWRKTYRIGPTSDEYEKKRACELL